MRLYSMVFRFFSSAPQANTRTLAFLANSGNASLAMLGAITAYELDITALRGTRKLSQNKTDDEVAGVLVGMDGNGMSAIAGAMRELRR